jgi:hypothetical protein
LAGADCHARAELIFAAGECTQRPLCGWKHHFGADSACYFSELPGEAIDAVAGIADAINARHRPRSSGIRVVSADSEPNLMSASVQRTDGSQCARALVSRDQNTYAPAHV